MTQVDGNESIRDESFSLDEASENLPPKEFSTSVLATAKPLLLENKGKPLPVMQEETRAKLAKYLIYGWAATIIAVFVIILGDKYIYYSTPNLERANIKDQTGAKDLITLVLTTQSTLVGAAIGFYFGTRDTK